MQIVYIIFEYQKSSSPDFSSKQQWILSRIICHTVLFFKINLSTHVKWLISLSVNICITNRYVLNTVDAT